MRAILSCLKKEKGGGFFSVRSLLAPGHNNQRIYEIEQKNYSWGVQKREREGIFAFLPIIIERVCATEKWKTDVSRLPNDLRTRAHERA